MLHGMSARTSSDQVQAVGQRIWMFQVEHVWRNLVTQGQYRENRGGRASGSQDVADGGFRGRNGGAGACSKHLAYGRQLSSVTDKRGGRVRIQVLNVVGLQPCLPQRRAHRSGGAGSVFRPGSDMIGIGGSAVAYDFRQRLGAASQRMIQRLQHQ